MDQLERERVDLLVSRFKSFDSRVRRDFVTDFFALYRDVKGQEAYEGLLRYVAGLLYSGEGDPVLGCLREHYVGKVLELINSFGKRVKDIFRVSRQFYLGLNDRKEELLR
jgi:hypothetical protein